MCLVLKEFQEYKDFDASEEDSKTKKRLSANQRDELFPLGENVLVNNIGIPIVVVVTKVEVGCLFLLLRCCN